MNVEKTVEFLLQNQARHDTALSRLETSVGRLERLTESLAQAAIRTERRMAQLAEQRAADNKKIDQRISALSQKVDQRILALSSAVSELIRRQGNGKV